MHNWTGNYCEEENNLLAYNRFMLDRLQQQQQPKGQRTHTNLANVIQSPSQNPSQHQEFLPISRSFIQSIQEDSCNSNGNAVDAFSPSSSESSLVSQMLTSINDNDLSSNSKSKAKHGRKGIINEKQWRSDEIMQLISMWEQKEELYNAASPDYSIREKSSKATKEIAEKLETTEEAVSRKMASLKSYYCQLKQSYKAAKAKSRSGTSDVKKPVWSF